MICEVCGYKEEYRKNAMQFCKGEYMASRYNLLTMEGMPKPVINIAKRCLDKHIKDIEKRIKVNKFKDDVKAALIKQERTMMWLIRKTKIPRSTFYYKLDYGFTEDEAKRIMEVLK